MLLAVARRGLLLTVLVMCLDGAAYAGASTGWMAVQMRGAVVCLQGGEWVEIPRGAELSDPDTVRTLRGSNLVLRIGGGQVTLGSNTAIQLARSGEDGVPTVMQHSGIVTVEGGVTVETPVLAVFAGRGEATVAFDGDVVQVSVLAGTVSVVDRPSGRAAVLNAGQRAAGSAATGLDVGGTGAGGYAPEVPEAAAGGDAQVPAGGGVAQVQPESSGNGGNGTGDDKGNGNGVGSGNGNGGANGKVMIKIKD